MLALEGGDAEQAEAGDFVRVGLERFVGQGLGLGVPLLVVGKVQRLGPLSEQLRLTPGNRHGALEDLGGIGGTLLGHVGTTEEVQAFGRVRLGLHRQLQAAGHFFHGLRRLGKLLGQLDLLAGTEMQVQAQAHQRHQYGGQQRQRLAQTAQALRFGVFGVGQQLAGSFIPALGQLRLIKHASRLLGSQLGNAFLVQGDVQCGAVFFQLRTTAAQHRDQQKAQGHQQQQACSKPEISHGSVLCPAIWRGAHAPRGKGRRCLQLPGHGACAQSAQAR
ncbi:hypothetical protein D3C79_746790 [compost metagenome]